MGKCLSGQMSYWANVFLGNCLLGKYLMGKWQMAPRQISPRSNVDGQMSLGRCLVGKSHRTVL
jgi:hypothetical protein